MSKKKGKFKLYLIFIFMAVITVAFFSVFLFRSCSIKYNAKIIDSGIEYQQEFLKNSLTYGASKYELYDSYDDFWESGDRVDTTSPPTRTYIVKDNEALEEIFTEFPEVNFEKEMVLVHCYTSNYGRKKLLKSVKLNDQNILNIVFTIENGLFRFDAAEAQRRILIIRLNKLDIKETNFEYVKPKF